MSKHIHIHICARKKATDANEYTGRNTGPDKWNVFKKGSPVAVAGPFKTAAEASAWIKNHTNDAYRGPWTEEVEPDEFKRLPVGKTINRKGVKARVVSKHINNAKKTENGTMIPQKFMVGFETVDGAKDSNSGKLSASLEKQIGTEGSSHREGMPANVFLEPAERKYPVKEQENGEWKWSKKLLIAAAREARMHGDELLAKRADEIRAREFGADI